MTTSGTYSWPLTAEQIVTHALREIGAYAGGETPSSEDMEDAIDRLNAMLKSWQGEGAMYREATGTVTVPAGTGSVAVPADARDISSVRHVVSASYSRQLAEWNRSQFYSLPNRIASGNPSIYYVSKTTSGGTISIWPVPSVDITLELDFGKPAETVTDPAETLDIPEEWQETVIVGLASRCASMFGTTRIDPASVQRIDGRAAALFSRMMDRDRPNSYYFEPDY